MKFYIFTLSFFFILPNIYSQSNGSCVKFGNKIILTGIYLTGNSFQLKTKNYSGVNISFNGNQQELGFTTESYDPNSVFNFAADIGFRFTQVNVFDTLGGKYKFGSIAIRPTVTYSPCFLGNKIGLRLNPITSDYKIFINGDDKSLLRRFNFSWGIGIQFNKEVPLGVYSHDRYFNVYHWQVFLDYSQSYGSRFFKNIENVGTTNPIFNIKTREQMLGLGFRLIFSGYEH